MAQPKILNRKLYFLLILLLQLTVIFSACNSRQLPIDSEIAHVDSLLDEVRNLMIQVDMPGAAELAFEVLDYSRKVNYDHGEVRAIYLLGQNLHNAGLRDEALNFFKTIDTTKTTPADALYLAQIYKVKGQAYFTAGQTDEALRTFDDAHHQAALVEDVERGQYVASQIYESQAVTHNGLGNHQQALNYLLVNQELLDQMDEDFVFNNKINNYGLLGEQYLMHGQLDSAAHWFSQSLDIIHKYNYAYKSRVHIGIGQIHLLKEPAEPNRALDQFYTALQNINDTGLQFELPKLYDLMSQAFDLLDQPASALYYNVLREDIEEQFASNNSVGAPNAVQQVVDNYYKKNSMRLKRKISLLLGGVAVLTLILLVLFRTKKSEQS